MVELLADALLLAAVVGLVASAFMVAPVLGVFVLSVALGLVALVVMPTGRR